MSLILPGTITISRMRLYNLLVAERKLEALEAGGVDNWDWFSDSLEEHYIEPTNGDLDEEEIEK